MRVFRRLMTSKVVVAILLGILVPSQAVAKSPSVEVAGTTLNLPVGAGQCALDENAYPLDAFIMNGFRKAYVGEGELLQVAYDCNGMESLRFGSSAFEAEHWGQIVFVYAGEPKQARRFPELTRESYLNFIHQSVVEHATNGEKIVTDRDVQKMVKRLSEAMDISASVGEMHFLGVLEQDQNAVYYAMMTCVTLNQTNRWVLYVTATSLVKGLPINIYQYAPFSGVNETPHLLERAKQQMEALIYENEAGI